MIQDELKRAMSAEADQLQPRTDLAETVITRGRRARRTRRVGLGVAVVTGIVAVAMLPGAVLQSTRPNPAVSVTPTVTPPVTPTPAPGPRDADPPFSSLPKGPPPHLPYVAGDATSGGYLVDGDTRVHLKHGLQFAIWSRVDGGWLVSRSDSGAAKSQLGVKRPDGTFQSLAIPLTPTMTYALSMDGRHIAFTTHAARLVVLDVKTGEPTASTSIFAGEVDVIGWNAHGIWLARRTMPGSRETVPTWLWQPGGKLRLVPDADALDVERASTRMIRYRAASPTAPRCAEVVDMGSAGRLDLVRRFCVTGLDITGASLSPDGRLILLPDRSVRPVDDAREAVRLRTPSQTPMSLVYGLDDTRWDDDTNVLVSVHDPFNHQLARCNGHTGRCERAIEHPLPHPDDSNPNDHYFSVATR